MFNIKRIALALSILGLVGLTGALLAGPAFAKAPESKHAKFDICHYGDGDWVDNGNGLELVPDSDGWMVKNTSNDSVQDHLDNHTDGTDDDVLIGDLSGTMFAGFFSISAQECEDRNL